MLIDLNELALKAQKNCNEYSQKEITLSDEFKSEYSQLLSKEGSDTIRFSSFTSLIQTNTGLNIFVPNQWFYIASFFVEYINELRKYKSIYDEIVKPEKTYKELTKQFKEEKLLSTQIESKIKTHLRVEEGKLFTLFLTKYDWWFGSKTIDRGDYYVSPILSLGNLVNNSQSYVADIANILSKKPALVKLLYLSNESNKVKEENILDDFINWFINRDGINHNYYSGKYSSNKEKLRIELIRYEKAYQEQFERPIFQIDLVD